MPLAPFHQGNLLSLVHMTSSIDITPPNQAFQTLFHVLLLSSSLNESLTPRFASLHALHLALFPKRKLCFWRHALLSIAPQPQELRVNDSKRNKNSVAILQTQLYKSYLNNCKECSEQPPGLSSTTGGCPHVLQSHLLQHTSVPNPLSGENPNLLYSGGSL